MNIVMQSIINLKKIQLKGARKYQYNIPIPKIESIKTHKK